MEGDPFSNLSEKQKQDTLQLMEIANIQKPEEAKHFMEMANFDMNNAMALFFEHGSNGQQQQHQFNDSHQNEQQMFNEQPQQQQMFNADQHLYDGPNEQLLQQLQYHFQQAHEQQMPQLDGINPETLRKYKIFKERKEMEDSGIVGKTFDMIGKGTKSLFNSLVPIGIRGERPGGEEFLQLIKKKIDLEKTYEFQKCQFKEIQEKAHYQSRPVMVFLYQDSCPSKQLQISLLQDKKLKYEMDKSFYCIGILNTSEEAKTIQKHVKSDQWPAFIYFRLNLFEKDEVLDVVTITNQKPDPDYYLQKAKEVRNQFYMKKSQDDKVRQVAQQQERQQRMANNPFHNQHMAYSQMMFQQQQPQQNHINQQQEQERQKRLEEERRLKAQQEREYQESIKLQKQKDMEKWEEEKKQQDEEIQKIIQEQLREEEIKKKVQSIPQEPAEDAQGIIKLSLRCPMGERVFRRFLLSDKVQLVYDYVETNKDIEFEHSLRQFDLIQAAPYLNLSDKKDKTLDEVFDGSDYELLNISEK